MASLYDTIRKRNANSRTGVLPGAGVDTRTRGQRFQDYQSPSSFQNAINPPQSQMGSMDMMTGPVASMSQIGTMSPQGPQRDIRQFNEPIGSDYSGNNPVGPQLPVEEANRFFAASVTPNPTDALMRAMAEQYGNRPETNADLRQGQREATYGQNTGVFNSMVDMANRRDSRGAQIMQNVQNYNPNTPPSAATGPYGPISGSNYLFAGAPTQSAPEQPVDLRERGGGQYLPTMEESSHFLPSGTMVQRTASGGARAVGNADNNRRSMLQQARNAGETLPDDAQIPQIRRALSQAAQGRMSRDEYMDQRRGERLQNRTENSLRRILAQRAQGAARTGPVTPQTVATGQTDEEGNPMTQTVPPLYQQITGQAFPESSMGPPVQGGQQQQSDRTWHEFMTGEPWDENINFPQMMQRYNPISLAQRLALMANQ